MTMKPATLPRMMPATVPGARELLRSAYVAGIEMVWYWYWY